jgi:TonB family protein
MTRHLLSRVPSNQSMKPTAPLQSNFSVFATTPAVAYLFPVRPMKHCLVIVLVTFIAHVALADSISKPRKEDLIYAPRPEYPYKARLHYLRGSGSFILRVRTDGTIARVDVEDSTGAPLLDQTAIAAYSKWRFKPGRVKAVRVPISFTMAPYPYKPGYVPSASR